MATGLQGAVNEAVLLCSSVLAASDVDVHIQGHETDVWVEPGSLQQVLVNLIQNAVDALQSASQRRLVFDVERVGDVARLRVSDTGSGMTPEAMQKLFDRGFSTKGDNRGLGLSSCRRLVEGMGGTLQGSSDGPGLGACFELTLPGPE